MTLSRRVGMAPVPENLDAYLNKRQMAGLTAAQAKGWAVKFVRRPAFQNPTVVLAYRNGRRLGLLEEDGNLNVHTSIALRSGGPGDDSGFTTSPTAPFKYLV